MSPFSYDTVGAGIVFACYMHSCYIDAVVTLTLMCFFSSCNTESGASIELSIIVMIASSH